MQTMSSWCWYDHNLYTEDSTYWPSFRLILLFKYHPWHLNVWVKHRKCFMLPVDEIKTGSATLRSIKSVETVHEDFKRVSKTPSFLTCEAGRENTSFVILTFWHFLLYVVLKSYKTWIYLDDKFRFSDWLQNPDSQSSSIETGAAGWRDKLHIYVCWSFISNRLVSLKQNGYVYMCLQTLIYSSGYEENNL